MTIIGICRLEELAVNTFYEFILVNISLDKNRARPRRGENRYIQRIAHCKDIMVMDERVMRYLKGFPIVVKQRVDWGDMDAHGHVNNAVYFRYIENARIVYYEKIGKYDYEERTGVSFVVASTGCSFKYPLTYPDIILVGARVSEIDGSHIVMKYRIISTEHNIIAADAEAVIVSYHYGEKKKISFPLELNDNIRNIEESSTCGGEHFNVSLSGSTKV